MISQSIIGQLFGTAAISAPREMCGLLFPESQWYLVVNMAQDPEHEFLIDPIDYVRACMLMDGKPWAVVHSHPTKGARPSVKDCQLMDELAACGQDLKMLIVGLDPREIRVYKKRGHVYQCEWVHGADYVTVDP